MKNLIFVLSLMLTTTSFAQKPNLTKDIKKFINDDYNESLDLKCSDLNLMDKLGDQKLHELESLKPNEKEKRKNLEKELDRIFAKKEEVSQYHISRAVLFQQITGKMGMTLHTIGVIDIKRICARRPDLSEVRISQIMLMVSGGDAAHIANMNKIKLEYCEQKIKSCKEFDNSSNKVIDSSQREMGKIIEKMQNESGVLQNTQGN